MAIEPDRQAADPADAPGAASLDHLLDRAAATLREHTDEGWVRARDSLVARVLSAVRPSSPVRGRHAHGSYFVATAVLSGAVRRALEPHTRARLLRLTFDTTADHTLTAVTAQVSAQFDEPLVPLADEVRRIIADRLRACLGTPDLPEAIVRVDLVVADVYST